MTSSRFFPNLYRDSVALMQLSAKLGKIEGVVAASAQMATAANLTLMHGAGLLEAVPSPRPSDILLVIKGSEKATEEAFALADSLLNAKAASNSDGVKKEPLRSVQMAFKDSEGEKNKANLVLISTPGDYAAAEAMKALRLGMNAMLFSDNVSVDEEIALKKYAQSRGLLVMGPDCGTAIVDGMPLAFANVVTRGNIGVIGASGTGLQQVTCLIDQFGAGITHAIGTGGHDLAEAVGGITMLTALQQFAEDKATEIICLVSKPPAASVAAKVLTAAKACKKPVVVCFLGAKPESISSAGENLIAARDLAEAAKLSAALSHGKSFAEVRAMSQQEADLSEVKTRAKALAAKLKTAQTNLRGLYTGGTFCYEALLLLQDSLPNLQSNTPTGKVKKVADLWKSSGHNILDLGDDDFTRGRPHPMIDPSLRNDRLIAEAADSSVGVILLDFVLGYGSHENPAGEIIAAAKMARENAKKDGRELVFIAHICGTKGDPQSLAGQEKILSDAGMELAKSNAEAALLCKFILENLTKGAN